MIISFPLSLCACRTSGGTASLEWEQGSVYEYYYEVPKPKSPSGQAVWKETSRKEPWQIIKCQHAFIQYKTLKDIEKFDNSIDYTPGNWGIKDLFPWISAKEPVDSIKQKVDALFGKVRQILEMYRQRNNIIINLYSQKDFFEIRNETYKKDCHVRAWYITTRDTIYINVDDVHEGMLAHEIAHAVIDNYLFIQPPKNTSEILARHVDKNIFY